MAAYANQFDQRGVKLLGLSCDDVQSHHEWIKDIEAFNVFTHILHHFSFLSIIILCACLANLIFRV